MGFTWAIDKTFQTGQLNAATPGVGLRAIPTEFIDDDTEPRSFYLNHDGQVIGQNLLIWSGWAEGLRTETFEISTQTYNCQTEDKDYYPTTSRVGYESGRVFIEIEGPVSSGTCSGDSFTEVVDHSRR